MTNQLEQYKEQSKIMDIEADGFLDSLTKLHVASVCYYNPETAKYKIFSTNDDITASHIIDVTNGPIIGHNFYLFDIPALEKILGGSLPLDNIIDTLFISWYIEPDRLKHGLDSYGEDFGIPKPKIDNWENLSFEEYKHRCEEDVKINTMLWHRQLNDLYDLYEGDVDKIKSLIQFLMTKARVYYSHLSNPLRIDIKGATNSLNLLKKKESEIIAKLMEVMPKTAVKTKKKRPKVMYKKDGTLSSNGQNWMDLIETKGYKFGQEPEEIEYTRGEKEPNPGSVSQIKDWFFSLGWKPDYFKETKLVDGTDQKVPQIKKGEDLCPSVLKLAEEEPAILEYVDLKVIQHRIGLLEGNSGFLNSIDQDGNIVADIGGLTNTLRIKHRTLVNMPSPSAPYGEHIRTHILPPKGHVMIGADLASLESTTRNHFVIDIDPAFVQSQSHPFYDPHLDIAVTAGMMSESEAGFYKYWKEYKKHSDISLEAIGAPVEDVQIILDSYDQDGLDHQHHRLNGIRQAAKTVNYSAMYGVGKAKLSKELGVTQKEAGSLLDAYWKINWSVKKFASSCRIREIGDQLWVKNPLNNYWYSLRFEKDIFSTINQSAGDFVFTLWEYFLLQSEVVIHGGFHDEIITSCPEDQTDKVVAKLYGAIDKVNEVLKMKVPVQIDYKIGNNYAEVH